MDLYTQWLSKEKGNTTQWIYSERYNNEEKFKYNNSVQYMHEVRWDNGGVSIYESSNICTPEIAQTNKFYKHLHSLISTTMKRLLTFDKNRCIWFTISVCWHIKIIICSFHQSSGASLKLYTSYTVVIHNNHQVLTAVLHPISAYVDTRTVWLPGQQ